MHPVPTLCRASVLGVCHVANWLLCFEGDPTSSLACPAPSLLAAPTRHAKARAKQTTDNHKRWIPHRWAHVWPRLCTSMTWPQARRTRGSDAAPGTGVRGSPAGRVHDCPQGRAVGGFVCLWVRRTISPDAAPRRRVSKLAGLQEVASLGCSRLQTPCRAQPWCPVPRSRTRAARVACGNVLGALHGAGAKLRLSALAPRPKEICTHDKHELQAASTPRIPQQDTLTDGMMFVHPDSLESQLLLGHAIVSATCILRGCELGGVRATHTRAS